MPKLKPRKRPSTAPARYQPKKRQIQKSAAFWEHLSRQEPNNAEMTLFGIMCYLGLSYKYTGNGQFILSGMCPDFIHLKSRKIVEMYGERWHLPQEELERIKLFARSDYQTLIIWSKELAPKSREKLYKRLLDFEALPDIVKSTSF
jgi:very-short-patch-repair endonuclease